MSFFDSLMSIVAGPQGPMHLKQLQIGGQQFDIYLDNTNLTHHGAGNPGGPVVAVVFRLFCALPEAPAVQFQLRAGDWNDAMNAPKILTDEADAPLGTDFILVADDPVKAIELFSNPYIQQDILGLKNVYADLLTSDEKSELSFDGEVVFGGALNVPRMKKIVRVMTEILQQLYGGTDA